MKKVTMSFKDKRFDVVYDAGKIQTDAIMARIKKEGFKPTLKQNGPLK